MTFRQDNRQHLLSTSPSKTAILANMQTVIQVTSGQLQKMAQYYAKYSGNVIPNGAIFSARTPTAHITGYQSGKVMFQGKGHSLEAAKWQTLTPASKANHNSDSIPIDFKNWSVLGSDEVGAGAYFGPLTTAAVFVSEDDLDWVRQLGIADSKTLTDQKMRAIAPEIIARLPHHVVNLMPEKYNQLQPNNNVNQLKAISHNFALAKVLDKIAPAKPRAILIDQFAQRDTYYRYLSRSHQPRIISENVYFTTKGEQYHLSVAAASILARVVELNTLKQLSKDAGVALPIGAGHAVDEVAAQLLRNGKDLSQFAKLHFANTKKAEHLV